MKIIYTDKHRLHDTSGVTLWSFGQAVAIEEVPARAEFIRSALVEGGFGTIQAPVDHGLHPIADVHTPDYLEYLSSAYQKSLEYFKNDSPVLPEVFPIHKSPGRKPDHILGTKGYYSLDTYCPILEGTWEAAYWSAQTALTAADLLLQGEREVFALCRPPGHHAGKAYSAGFCYLNNAAIAARRLQAAGRVAILDVDYHVANGTQDIFYHDPQVLVCSIHGDPKVTFPYYWGYADEHGEGPGEGTHFNFPLPIGSGIDVYLQTLDQALEKIRAFQPSYLVLSLGLDIVKGDPVGGFVLQTKDFQHVAAAIAGLKMPTLLLQEGGYLESVLADCTTSFMNGFLGK